jgi:hypothetical protein
MPQVILDELGIRVLVGQGETAGMAQHVRLGRRGREAAALNFRRASLTVQRCNGFRCSLTKNILPSGFSQARSLSHAPTAHSSPPRNGCVVDRPPFSRAT